MKRNKKTARAQRRKGKSAGTSKYSAKRARWQPAKKRAA
jgi:hypothetical protein